MKEITIPLKTLVKLKLYFIDVLRFCLANNTLRSFYCQRIRIFLGIFHFSSCHYNC